MSEAILASGKANLAYGEANLAYGEASMLGCQQLKGFRNLNYLL